ncbi:FecR family protein [Flavobacterium araucananum]|uniref:Iron dicitrate transport regulator FecR n=1 Tax=Flavobacterium araucananum TaxID=946678 RepID=A0A227NMS3_9FLAO|nr:FecR domain-containing protein [Flavobacterium araucananum]OXE99052.1 iron dicitrate transport regulator FecR [Flavobacterium araucananum]PWK01161.1 FecR family protein [Flavobacterium araucananum]
MSTEIIYKYLSNEASEQEVLILFEWIAASDENKKQFIALKKTWALAALTTNISSDSVSVISIRPKKKAYQYLKYAAVFLVLLGLGKLAFDWSQKTKSASKEIVLEGADGRSEFITKNNKGTLVLNENKSLIARKFPNQIIYFGKVQDQKVVYNTLKVPYGKTFKLILSDGTVVSLNSGTTLRYPEQFGINGKRNVYLTGEAFFEVAKDKQHPFIVNANEVDIEVLGTKFNISAYPENPTVNSTLVEGSIQMYEVVNQQNLVLLTPNQMATWNNNSKKITTKAVDPSFYAAWTKGELAFKDTPFSTIAKIIQRTYDVEIINENAVLAKQSFTGTIKIRESSVENILELLKRDTPFSYSIKENTITITNLP